MQGDRGCPRQPQGEQGVQGLQGEKGDTGEKGKQGISAVPKGENGEAPVITVAEDTPRSYKLHFQSGEQGADDATHSSPSAPEASKIPRGSGERSEP